MTPGAPLKVLIVEDMPADAELALRELKRAGMACTGRVVDSESAFRDELGTTPAAHVEELRVEAARRLLETTELTIAAIATRVGFRQLVLRA